MDSDPPVDTSPVEIDDDGDGFLLEDDCDDGDAAVNPDAAELCDGVDNDCDGETDEDTSVDASTWYADDDSDGYGDPDSTMEACEQPDEYVANDLDCNDNNEDGFGDAGSSTTACSQPSEYVSDDTGGFSCFGSDIEVVNATVTGNTVSGAEDYGGWADTDDQSACNWDVSYSNVYDNGTDFVDSLTDWTSTNGNISSTPGFTDVSSSDPADWDLTLSSSSSLVDVGDPSIYDADGSTSDIGAYGGPAGEDW